jgi:two-component system sensor histidine kinase EvgS
VQDTPLESTRAKLFFFLITLLFFSFPPAVRAEGASKAEPVTIQLRWHHQFQFAGFYAAIENGYYADEGLQVSLREFEPGKDRIAPVLDGRAHYGVGDPSLLLLRARGKPVVVLAQIFQHNPGVLITLRRSDILSADQLIGKKIMLSVDDIGDVSIQAMILDVLGDMDQVVTVPRADGL